MGDAPLCVGRHRRPKGGQTFHIGLYASFMPEYQIIENRISVRRLFFRYTDIVDHADIKDLDLRDNPSFIHSSGTITDIFETVDIDCLPQIGCAAV